MIGFKRLAEILGDLGKNGYNLDATKKEDLRVFLEEVLEGKDGETPENIVSAFREKLKTEAKNELKTDQIIIGQVKANPENEIKQEVDQFDQLKADLKAKNAEVEKLNKDLEAKNKTTEQPKQGNGAKYTATVGMGLAAGLIAFTALERAVRLEMLVMIGIAVVSALVAGGITYAALPSTQVNGAETQEVNENGKGK